MRYASVIAGNRAGRMRPPRAAVLVLLALSLPFSGCGILGFGGDDPPPATSVRSSPGNTTVVQTRSVPRTGSPQVPIASPPAEVVTSEPTPPPPKSEPRRRPLLPGQPVPVSPPTDPTDPSVADRYGFDGDRYLSLVTPEEMDVLRLRARGDAASHLSRFLTDKERENLRRRAAELTEIGADPLRVGE